MIEKFKKGSGIHIKPENKGKFTLYCNGKVTNECIAKGKRSSDPAVRKRATFAANSRKWRHLQGGILKVLLGNILQTAAVTENPAIMTAAGWRIDRNGNAKLDLLNSKEIEQLRNNLAKIGGAGITAPTIVGDIGALASAVRHPIQTAKAILNIPNDILFFLKEKNPIKIYHGSNREFLFKDARTASPANFGLHVTPNKEIAEHFGNIKTGYISKPNMKMIDTNGAMDYSIFPLINFYKGRGYLNLGNDKLRFNLIKKYGGRPYIYEDNMYLLNDVNIPISEFWKDSYKVPKMNSAKSAQEALKNNQKVSNILSNNGKKIIEYNNTVEYPGGTSYIVTDPRVIHAPEEYLNQIQLFKYPAINTFNKNE